MTDYNLTDQNNMRLCHRCRSSMHTLKTVPISLCRHTYCWLLKAYYFWGRKINLSGISPARRRRSGPNSVYVDMSRGGVTTFRKFWARLTHFGQNGGWDESRGARVFCGNPEDLSATSQRPIFNNLDTKRSSVSRCGIRKDICETFHFRGHFPPKSKIGQTRTSLRAGYRSRDALQRDTVYSAL